jgi:hypothetical protein
MGFSGADILMVLGEPNMLFTKLEKPLFFRRAVGLFNWRSVDVLFGLRTSFSSLEVVGSVID